MSDQANFSIPIETWVKVATNATLTTIHNKDSHYKYYRTYVDTGGAAPAAFTNGVVPAIAIPIFEKRTRELMPSAAGIDVYVTCFGSYFSTTAGTVSVDS